VPPPEKTFQWWEEDALLCFCSPGARNPRYASACVWLGLTIACDSYETTASYMPFQTMSVTRPTFTTSDQQQVSAVAEGPARRYVSRVVLYTEIDAQCDKLRSTVNCCKYTQREVTSQSLCSRYDRHFALS